MAKLTLTDESSGFQTTAQRNANYAAIETALENTLSRDGTSPNAMGVDLDMNSHKVINLAAPTANSDAARWVDVASAVGLSTAVPNQAGNGGRVLTTTGSTLVWQNAQVVVASIAEMQALTGLVDGAYVYCAGYYAKGDLGAGLFYYDSASSATADGGAVITPTTLSGRFIKCYSERLVHPEHFGAKGDGTTNDQTAFEKAILFIKSKQVSVAAMTYVYSTPELVLTEGRKYLVTGNLVLGQDIRIRGNRGIITSGSYPFPQTNPLFTSVNAGCHIHGVGITGFTDVVSIATGNLDASVITVSECDIQEWSGSAIKVDANSPSTYLTVDSCRFESRTQSPIVVEARCDYTLIKNCWIQGPCTTHIWNRSGTLYFENNVGVPAVGGAGACWILNDGLGVFCDNNRFGGETGAKLIVKQNVGTGGTNVNQLSITNNEVYTSSDPVVEFNELPDIFVMRGNRGFTGSDPIKYTTSIPSASLYTFGSRHDWSIENNLFSNMFGQRSNAYNTVATVKAALLQNIRASLSTVTLLASQKVADILYTEGGFGTSGSLGAGMSAGTSTDIYGATVQTISGTNSTSNQFNTVWTTLLNAYTPGVYTLVVNLEVVTSNTVAVTLIAGKVERKENLTLGKYTLTLSFYTDGTNNITAGYKFENLCSGATIAHGGLRIFSGLIDSYRKWNTESYANAAPTTGYHRVGDRVIRLAPAAGQPKAWVCTVAGTPGTWVSEGNL